MTVFLLKNKSEDSDFGRIDPYEEHIESAHFVPIMDYHSVNLEELQDRIGEEDNYDGIIVTSQRAVDALKLKLGEVSPSIRRKPIYTVGPTTAKRLKSLEFENVYGEESGNGSALAEMMLDHLPANARLIFLAGEIHRRNLPDRLVQAGHDVSTLVVYRTTPNANVGSFVNTNLSSGDWLVFFSPSHTQEVIDALRKTDQKYRLAAIGPTTREFLEKEGFNVDATAPEPTAFGLSMAINRGAHN